MELFRQRFFYLFAMIMMLVACGGSGGGTPGSDSVSISLNANSLSFTATRNGDLPGSQQIVATFQGEGVLAGVPGNQTLPGWLNVDYATPPTSTTTTFNVLITTTNLTAGNYSATLRFLTGNTATSATDYEDVQVSFQITDELSVQETALSFDTVIGDINVISAQSITVSGNNISWQASADQSWVQLGTLSGIGAGSIQITFDETGLAAGQHTATVTISNTANNYSETVAITLNIAEPAFQLSQTAFNLNGVNGKGITGSSLNIAFNNGMTENWSVTSSQSWLVLNTTTGTTPDSITLNVDAQAAALTSGSHTATLNFSATVLGNVVTETVNVSLELIPMTFTTIPAPISVSGINGSDLGLTAISFALDTDLYDHPWTLSSNNNWLLIDGLTSSGGTNSGSANITVNASIAPALASGDYAGSLTLEASVNGDTITTTINVSLSLTAATLSLSQSSFIFEGINGTDLGSQLLDLSLNTGSVTHPWSLVMDSGSGLSWMQADITTGQLDDTATTVTLTTDETGLTGNVYPGLVTITAQVNGDTLVKTIPLDLRLDPQKLFVADNGVLLNSFPAVSSQLTQTVRVTDNASQGIAWAATDNASWLTVTASGVTGADDLVLTANSAGLTTDVLNTAIVTITSADAKIENTETITVGFYVSSNDPASRVSVSLTDPNKVSSLIADPVRPFIYVSHGGTDIDVYNSYTGALDSVITSVGVDLRDLTISSDGSTLYVMDQSDDSIVPINLSTKISGTKFTGLSFPSCTSCASQWIYNSIEFTRINGYPVIISSGNQIIHAANGTVLGALTNPDGLSFYSPYSPMIKTSANGKIAAAQSVGGSPFSLARYSLQYSALESGSFSAVMTHKITGNGSAIDMAIDEAGSKIYTASGSGCGSYDFCIYSGDDLISLGVLAGEAYPTAIEISPDQDIYVGTSTNPGIPAAIDVRSYDITGTLTGSYADISASIDDRQLVLSGDGSIMVTRSRNWTGSTYNNNLDFILVKP